MNENFTRFIYSERGLIESALKAIEEYGVCIIESVLTKEECSNLKDFFLESHQRNAPWFDHRKTSSGYFMVTSPRLISKYKRDTKKIKDYDFISFVSDLSKRYLGVGSFIEYLVSDYKSKSESAITAWHTDDPAEIRGKMLKFMIYLDNTDIRSGAFSYAPRSHKLIRHLADSFPDKSEAETHLYEYRSIQNTARLLGLQNTELFSQINEEIDSNKLGAFGIAASGGSMVIFDSRGIHRGGHISEGSRHVFRIQARECNTSHVFSSVKSFKSYLHMKYCSSIFLN